MKTSIHKLESGYWIKARPVPPFVMGDLWMHSPPPPYPEVKLQGPGGEETAPALEGTPEMEDYKRRRDAYRKDERRRINDATLVYGIIAWFYDPEWAADWECEEGEAPPPPEEANGPWTTHVPEDWYPPDMSHFGIPNPDEDSVMEMRIAFIKHELISTQRDQITLDMATQGASPITDKEAKAAATPFGSSTQTASP